MCTLCLELGYVDFEAEMECQAQDNGLESRLSALFNHILALDAMYRRPSKA